MNPFPLRQDTRAVSFHLSQFAVDELEGRFLRVVTLSDKLTIHNAFLDRRFRP